MDFTDCCQGTVVMSSAQAVPNTLNTKCGGVETCGTSNVTSYYQVWPIKFGMGVMIHAYLVRQARIASLPTYSKVF